MTLYFTAPDWPSPTLIRTIWADTLWSSQTPMEFHPATPWLRTVGLRFQNLQHQFGLSSDSSGSLWLPGCSWICSLALNTMLELSYAIRHPGKRLAITPAAIPFSSLTKCWCICLSLSLCSRSSETQPQLWDSGEGTRAFLAAGRQAVSVRFLQVHR